MRVTKLSSILLGLSFLTTVAFAGVSGDKIKKMDIWGEEGAQEFGKVIEFVRSTAPFIDLSQVDAKVMVAAYGELRNQDNLGGALGVLQRVLRSYQTKSVGLPKILPAGLVAQCMSVFESLSADQIGRMQNVASLINRVIQDEAVVNNEQLAAMVDKYPSYFSYLANNVYRGFFQNNDGAKFSIRADGSVAQAADDNLSTIGYAMTSPDAANGTDSVSSFSITGGTNNNLETSQAAQAATVVITGQTNASTATQGPAVSITGGTNSGGGTASQGALEISKGGATYALYPTDAIFVGGGSGLALADGSVSAPSLSFTNDTDTGLYLDNPGGAKELGVTQGGVQRASFAATTAVNAVTALNLNAAASQGSVTIGSSDGGAISTDSGTSLTTIQNASTTTEAILIQSTGVVATADEGIHLHSTNATSTNAIHLEADDGGIAITNAGAAKDIVIDSTAGSVKITGSEDLADAVAVLADGGTASTLTIKNTAGTATGAIEINASAGTTGTLTIDSAATADEALLIRNTGVVGTTLDGIHLHSTNATSTNAIHLEADDGGIAITNAGAAKDIVIDSTAGSVSVTGSEDLAGALALLTDGGTASTMTLTNSAGTTSSAIDINASAAGAATAVHIQSAGTGAAAINITTPAAASATGGMTVLTGTPSSNGANVSGAVSITTGAGQANSGGTAGASGGMTLQSGVGGANTVAAGTGGVGGAIAITGGDGGDGVTTGGAGSAITLTAGDGGDGTTGGIGGNVNIQAGLVGSGGSPTQGAVIINSPGGNVAAATGAELRMVEPGTGTNYTAMRMQAQSADIIYLLPDTIGSVSDHLEISGIASNVATLDWTAGSGVEKSGDSVATELVRWVGTGNTVDGGSTLLTAPGTAITSGSINAETNANSVGLANDDGHTGTINIGTGDGTGTITIGGTGARTIAIGTGAAVQGVTLGSTNSTSSTTVQSGTGQLKLTTADTDDEALLIESTGVVAGSSDGIHLHSTNATSTSAIHLEADDGGIAITNAGAAKDIVIDSTAGSVSVTGSEDLAGALALLTDGGTASTMTLTNSAGTTSSAIDINASAAGASTAVHIQSAGTGAAAINVTTPDAASATGGMTFTTGDASGDATGSAGGDFLFTSGAGSATTGGSETGGAAGDMTITLGDGGNASGGTSTGGAGGKLSITGGDGGTSTTGTSAAGGVTITAGGNGTTTGAAVGLTVTGNAGASTTAPYANVPVFISNGTVATDTFTYSMEAVNDIAAANFRSSSDGRLKTNINSMDSEECLAKVVALRPVTFNFKEALKRNPNARKDTGFIAQEVKRCIPDLVGGTELDGGYLNVNYPKMVVELTGAIQALLARNESLKSRVDILEAKLESSLTTQKKEILAIAHAGLKRVLEAQ